MRVFARVALWLGLFLVATGLVYVFMNKEFEGFPLLMMAAGGFVLLAGWALSMFRRASRHEAAAEPGEPHVGPTIWPLVLALSAIAFVLGLLAAKWLYAIGGILFILAVGGWFSDVQRQWRRHQHADVMEHPDRG